MAEPELMEEEGTEPSNPLEFLYDRFVAKLIDLLLAGFLFELTPLTGPVAAIAYLLLCDGLKGGQSAGKRLVGLMVISLERGAAPCSFVESAKRNFLFALPFVLAVVAGWIPYVGKLLVLLSAVAVLSIEAYTLYEDEEGLRIGDRIASTMVVKVEQ